jgi:hypothetical protein
MLGLEGMNHVEQVLFHNNNLKIKIEINTSID